jgi:hypothetical protein
MDTAAEGRQRVGKVRVGIIGVGHCASSFVQGLSYYPEARTNEPVPGLMNAEIGGYRIGDVEIQQRSTSVPSVLQRPLNFPRVSGGRRAAAFRRPEIAV